MTEALWYLGRGTGIAALVVLTGSVAVGIATRSGRRTGSLSRFAIADVHQTLSLTGVGLVATHVATLMFDPFAHLRPVDVVVPFLAPYRPAYVGLGTLAAELIVIVAASSLLRHRIGPRPFHAVHWTAYLLWPLAFAHALGSGSDVGTWWFRSVAACCAALAGLAVGWRVTGSFRGRGWQRTPREVTR